MNDNSNLIIFDISIETLNLFNIYSPSKDTPENYDKVKAEVDGFGNGRYILSTVVT